MLLAGRRMTSKLKNDKGHGRQMSQKSINKMKFMAREGADAIVSVLFPPRCLVCDEILEPEEKRKGIHLACANKLYPIYGAVCMHCGRPLGDRNQEKQNQYESTREYCFDCERIRAGSSIVQGKSLYLYKGAIKKSMYRFKYSNKREYAAYFAEQAVKQYGAWMQKNGIEAIIPVPMYPQKQRRRGYNQAECFAKELGRVTGVPVDTKCVRRIEDTKPLKTLDPVQRKNNLKNAFQKGKNVVQYSCVLVVDDIYTTGSTAEAVAQELIKQGTRKVYLLTVCIGGDM